MEKRKFLIVRKGSGFITIRTENIVFIFTENDVTYIVTDEGKKIFCTQSLNTLEPELDHTFFRANRQYIINMNFISSFRIHERSKIIVEMNVDDPMNVVYISQVTAPKFKKWIYSF